ncbi:hypothetical protein PR048_011233 [Dryococelus australis]|uniref:Uncharacterized protein n=1 Tax=Dryococelus australis TaxID=614101 RepID=A0ABQ9HLB6_9NEOP|nr:hypothetical protein PR048_011233 [Dryococelus australis]
MEVNSIQIAALIKTEGSHVFVTPRFVTAEDNEPWIVHMTSVLVVMGLCEKTVLGQLLRIKQDAVIRMGVTRIHVGWQERQTTYAIGTTPPTPSNPVQLLDFQHGVPLPYQAVVQRVINEWKAVFAETEPLQQMTLSHASPQHFARAALLRQGTRLWTKELHYAKRQSEYNFQIVLVVKKDGTTRFGVDSHPVNDVSLTYPLHLISIQCAPASSRMPKCSGNLPHSKLLRKITNAKIPMACKQMHLFIRFVNRLRHFVYNSAMTVAPLMDLLSP